ncbi:hypothetical protein [Clostridium algidicarnis]|uniref:hypothetical protein n=1 Tax=Clostridium algidicarnis TaxID=37659 RepID=UPI001C0BB7F2|nr:hypothetical protein [Clostridium algidicarnis]MBU3228908.1 hypothetical protein [Clostridium algidicarnis]MBU3252452.1 hypothetical protein [Clostridium algidicarnis]
MTWNEKDYPDSMKNLDYIVKRKAINIANDMIKEKGLETFRNRGFKIFFLNSTIN